MTILYAFGNSRQDDSIGAKMKIPLKNQNDIIKKSLDLIGKVELEEETFKWFESKRVGPGHGRRPRK